MFDNAVELFEGAHGLLETNRVADLNGAGQRLLRLNGLEGLKIAQVRAIKRVGPLCLGDNDARQPGDQPKVFHQQQSFAQGGDIAQVAAGDDKNVGRLPIELLDDLDAHG